MITTKTTTNHNNPNVLWREKEENPAETSMACCIHAQISLNPLLAYSLVQS